MVTFHEFTSALTAAEDEHGPLEPSAPSSSTFRKARGDIGNAEIAKVKSAVQHLIEKSLLHLDDYGEWQRLSMAMKHSLGDAGFDLFHEFSAGAAGYEGEADCRTTWDSVGEPPDKPLTVATYYKRAKDAGWKWASAGNGAAGAGKPKSPAPAIVVRSLVAEAGDLLWVDMQGGPHVTFRKVVADGRTRELHAPIDGSAYRSELCARYANAVPDKVLSKVQLDLVVGLLTHQAKDGGKHQTFLRSGMHEGALYIDLGQPSGRAVRVHPDGVTIVDQVPIRFLYRGEGMGELPLPEPGGTIADFQRHYNLSPEDVVSLVAFQLVALVGAESYPIGHIDGRQGTGKSTLADMTVSLVDPPGQRKDGRSTFSGSEEDLYIRVSNAHLPYFDNISVVDQKASDWICRLSTGGKFSTRVRYTDREEHSISLCRPVLATAIGSPTKRGDFVDRMIRVTALPVTHYRTEKRVWRDFEADRPKLFGFLIHAAQIALRNLEQAEQDMDDGAVEAARMSDFGAVIEAAAEVLGLQPGEFSYGQRRLQEQMQAEAAIGNPLVLALHEHLSRSPEVRELEGTAGEILATVKNPTYTPPNWPSATQLKRILMRDSAGIAALGLSVTFIKPQGNCHQYRYRIGRSEGFVPTKERSAIEKSAF
jgi:ABC-type dipeptide/oligopeptide/nickel transport system ATPase component